jgi:hypothetical protein
MNIKAWYLSPEVNITKKMETIQPKRYSLFNITRAGEWVKYKTQERDSYG